jgi:hypothetical protein
MCKTTKPITQADITVARSIARETVKGIIRVTGFPSDAEIIFTDEQVDSPRNVKNLFDKCRDANGIRTRFQDFVFVEFEDRFTEEGVARHRPGNGPMPPVFLDPGLNIALEPIYAESEMTLTMRFRANDRSRLSHWVNALRLRHGLVDLLMTIGIRNDWSIPYRFVEFIYDAYKLREKVAPYNETFAEYCKQHFVKGMQLRSNLNQSHNEMIINEVQKHVRGWVDDKEFYNSREIQAGIYECTMTYKFRYQRIIANTLYYPPTIHNQFIAKEYADEFIHPWVKEVRKAYTRPWTYAGNVLLGHDETFFYLGDGGARTLEWDDWFPNVYDRNTQTVLITPFAVDPSDPEFVFHLDDLGDEYLPAVVKKFLRKNKDNLYEINKTLVKVELFSVSDTEKIMPVYIDVHDNIRTKSPVDLRSRNYVRISLVKDLAKLNPVFVRDLLNDPDFLDLLQFYDPTLTTTDDSEYWDKIMPVKPKPDIMHKYPSILLLDSNGKISDRSFWYWLIKMDKTNSWFKNLRQNNTLTVGQANINVRK